MARKRDRIIGVYAILNTITGETYIGSSKVDVIHRIDQHICSMKHGHPRKYIKEAIDIYGIEAFSFVILEICSPEQCRERETFWLQEIQPEYNSVYNGYSTLGFKHSLETKAKMSLKQIGNQKFKGHTLSEDAKKIIGNANRAHWIERKANLTA